MNPFIGIGPTLTRRRGGGGIPFASDLSFYSSERSGAQMLDTISTNHATILTPILSKPAGNEYAYIADNGALDIGAGDLTLCGWVKTTQATPSTYYLIGKNIGGNVNGRYGIGCLTTTGYLFGSIRTSGGDFIITSNVNFFASDWLFLAMTVDNTAKKLRFLINNQQVDNIDFTGTLNALANQFEFYIGSGNNSTGSGVQATARSLHGDTYIFKRKLSDVELTTLYNRGVVTGAEGHWDCVLRKDNEILDLSGNGRHLTGVNLTLATNKKYDTKGSLQGLNLGYTRYYKEASKDIHYSYKDDGTALTGITPTTGYTEGDDYAGIASQHNGADSMIRFVDDVMDRSNTSRCNAVVGRNVYNKNYYDTGNVKDWHVDELRNINIWSSFYPDYNGRTFSQITGRTINQILTYTTNKTDSNYDKVINYLNQKYVNIDYEYTDNYVAVRGNKILRFNNTTKVLSLSSDNGTTFPITLNLNGVVSIIDFAHIFANGNILFCNATKCYYSDDNLSTYQESTVLAVGGGAFSPGSADNYRGGGEYAFPTINGLEVLTWGPYVVNGDGEYDNINIWYSIDNGETIKSFYKFDSSLPAMSARHVHSVQFNSSDSSFWICTGDYGASGIGNTTYNQCNWIKATYNTGTDAWTVTKIADGNQNSYYKTIGFVWIGDYMYWSSDSDNSAYRGVWRVPYNDPANTAKFERVMYYDYQLLGIVGDINGYFATGYSSGGQVKDVMFSINGLDWKWERLLGGDTLNATFPSLWNIRYLGNGKIISDQIVVGETINDYPKGQKIIIQINPT